MMDGFDGCCISGLGTPPYSALSESGGAPRVFGWLVMREGIPYIVTADGSTERVRPLSVRRWAGLLDKKGLPVYAGYVVRAFGTKREDPWTSYPTDGICYIVTDEGVRFRLVSVGRNRGLTIDPDEVDDFTLEVVGDEYFLDEDAVRSMGLRTEDRQEDSSIGEGMDGCDVRSDADGMGEEGGGDDMRTERGEEPSGRGGCRDWFPERRR